MVNRRFIKIMTVEEIRKTIEDSNITYRQLEKFSGVPEATIRKFVTGRTQKPRKGTIDALSRILSPWNSDDSKEAVVAEMEESQENEMLMSVEEMRAEIQRRGYSYMQLERFTAIPAATIRRIIIGQTKKPRMDVMLSLSAVLRPSSRDASIKQQENYDLEDYLALSEDERMEMIDGILYELPGPDEHHQFVLGAIFHSLYGQIRDHGKVCFPFMAPLDVQLDKDDRTIVQPDIFLAGDSGRFKEGKYYGAPELVVEIISRETVQKDFQIKYMKYKQACVKEYWIVDIPRRRVITWVFKNETASGIYCFDEQVPVMAFKGAFTVDFPRIWKEMDAYFKKPVEGTAPSNL